MGRGMPLLLLGVPDMMSLRSKASVFDHHELLVLMYGELALGTEPFVTAFLSAGAAGYRRVHMYSALKSTTLLTFHSLFAV